jgi:type IV pilus assembly protein PilW
MTARASSHTAPRRAGTGFSLIELLVAVMIGLIGTVVIFQVFAIFEGQKRTTTSAGDAQQNGLLALSSLERDARMAGYGLGTSPLLGCNVTAYDSTGSRDFSFTLAGVQIADGASGAPDTVTFTYSTSGMVVYPPILATNIPASPAQTSATIGSGYGFTNGDLIVIGQSGAIPLAACYMKQLTAAPASGLITFADGARYNKSGGLAAGFSAWDNTALQGGMVFDLGPAPPAGGSPVIGIYSIASGQLMYQNLLTDTAGSAVADGIVQLQAQYGYDTSGDGSIQTAEWTNAAPADWTKVIAVRMAVLARSAEPEKPDPTTLVCNTTTVAPTWSGGTIDPSVVDPTSWQCYRYRLFETQVAVRNLIWFPQ